jgi:hypothetical protein
LAAFTFAHLALWAAAIFLRASGLIVRLGFAGVVAPFFTVGRLPEVLSARANLPSTRLKQRFPSPVQEYVQRFAWILAVESVAQLLNCL